MLALVCVPVVFGTVHDLFPQQPICGDEVDMTNRDALC